MSSAISRLSRLSTFAKAERASAALLTATNDPRNAGISQLLHGRVSNFGTVRSSLPVLEAVEMMTRQNTGHLLVTGETGTRREGGDGFGAAADDTTQHNGSVAGLKGIVTERDVLLATSRLVKDGEGLLVRDIMSADPVTVNAASATIGECMELMISKGFRHIPVTDEGELVGVLSIRDLVQRLVDDHRDMVTDLNVQLSRLSALGVDLDGSSDTRTKSTASSSWWA